MNLKKFISGISALTIAASAFAGLAVTASAADDGVVQSVSGAITWDCNGGSNTNKTYKALTTNDDITLNAHNQGGGGGGRGAIFVATPVVPTSKQYVKVDFNLAIGGSNSNGGNLDLMGAAPAKSNSAPTANRLVDIAWTSKLGAVTVNGTDITNKLKLDTAEKSADYYHRTAVTPISVLMDFSTRTFTLTIGLTDGTDYTSDPIAMKDSTGDGFYGFADAIGRYYGSVAISDLTTTLVSKGNVSEANYTVNFIDGNGAVKQQSVRTGIVDNPIVLTPEDTADFTNESTGVKYLYVSDNSANATVASDGSTVVNVVFRTAGTFDYTAKTDVGNIELASGTAKEKDTIAVPFPLYVNVNGTLYSKAATSGGDYNNQFKMPFTLTEDNQEMIVGSYSATNITNVSYYAEGEDIDSLTPINGNHIAIRASKAYAGTSSTAATLTTVTPGYYIVKGRIANTASASGDGTSTITLGDNVINTTTGKNANTSDFSSGDTPVHITEDTALTYVSSDSNYGLDYIYLIRGDYLFTFTDGPVYEIGNSGDTVYLPTPADQNYKGWMIDGKYYAGGTSYTFTDHDVEARVANPPVEISDTDYQTITYNNEEYTAAKLLVTVNGTVNGIRVWYGNLHRDATDMSVITDGTILLGAIVESGVTVDSNTFTVEAIN